jgi:hypothetical protein
MEQPEEFVELASSRGFLLARHAAVHGALVLVLLSLFAAADSWHLLTGWTMASILACVTGVVAGFALTTVLHEWFHWLGAAVSGGSYSIPANTGLFVFDWQFDQNSVQQFYVMSIAGSVGGILAALLLGQAIETDAPGRVAVIAGAVASVAFAAIIEWPVLIRTRASGNPLQELSAITPGVLGRASLGAALAGVLCAWLL